MCLFFMDDERYEFRMSHPSSMDILGCLVCLTFFLVLVALVLLAVFVTRSLRRQHVARPVWPWSITTYNGWNQAIPSLPVVRASFPRPWA